ncbi:MAG: hypothetical protein U9R74_03120 [Pseudomonadota bacterium]|nr:hypothetical protein [Pseudomonadota bacterium]
MPDKPEHNHIPTLGDVLEPGHVRSDTRPPAGKDEDDVSPRGPRSAFEVRMEAMIGEILKRHMEAAREEIMRTVHEAIRRRKPPE